MWTSLEAACELTMRTSRETVAIYVAVSGVDLLPWLGLVYYAFRRHPHHGCRRNGNIMVRSYAAPASRKEGTTYDSRFECWFTILTSLVP